MRTRPSAARNATIRQRQDGPTWGSGYLPGQLATREEAPDYSRPTTIYSHRHKRQVHLMSEPELGAFLLAEWLDRFFELHEGRMLHPEPSPGFLIGCPLMDQTYVAAHPGTLQVADELGLIKYHPIFRSAGKPPIAFPMLADLLLFGRDSNGIYPVNWCIKNELEDFDKAFKRLSPGERKKSDVAHQARLEIEEKLFFIAKIRTIHIAGKDMPPQLVANLRQIYPSAYQPRNLPNNLVADFLAAIRERIPNRVPLHETFIAFTRRHGGSMYDYRTEFQRAIWTKEVRCDLGRPLQMDRPLTPEKERIEDRYEMWCARGVK